MKKQYSAHTFAFRFANSAGGRLIYGPFQLRKSGYDAACNDYAGASMRLRLLHA